VLVFTCTKLLDARDAWIIRVSSGLSVRWPAMSRKWQLLPVPLRPRLTWKGELRTNLERRLRFGAW
jgi:hypothetical protein